MSDLPGKLLRFQFDFYKQATINRPVRLGPTTLLFEIVPLVG
jgi:hypothetical protein